jgi:hypothetical protein
VRAAVRVGGPDFELGVDFRAYDGVGPDGVGRSSQLPGESGRLLIRVGQQSTILVLSCGDATPPVECKRLLALVARVARHSACGARPVAATLPDRLSLIRRPTAGLLALDLSQWPKRCDQGRRSSRHPQRCGEAASGPGLNAIATVGGASAVQASCPHPRARLVLFGGPVLENPAAGESRGQRRRRTAAAAANTPAALPRPAAQPGLRPARSPFSCCRRQEIYGTAGASTYLISSSLRMVRAATVRARIRSHASLHRGEAS